MSIRKIVGFNDEMVFEVIDDQIRVIDNGNSYKNKLRNGLLLDTLCSMDVQYEDIIFEQSVENIKENKCIKINYNAEIPNERRTQVINEINNKRRQNKKRKNERQQNKKKINEKEKKRRDKRKMLKIGNDYKMRQYDDNNNNVFRKVSIPTNHFGKKEVDKYAPLCNDCFVFAMLSKRYYILYKCSYDRSCCEHLKCWMCTDGGLVAFNGNKFCCVECHDIWRSNIKCRYLSPKKLKRTCNCGEKYGYDYGKKYKCGTYFGFDFNTHINYNNYLDHNGNIIVEINDENIDFEPSFNEKYYFSWDNDKDYDTDNDDEYYDLRYDRCIDRY